MRIPLLRIIVPFVMTILIVEYEIMDNENLLIEAFYKDEVEMIMYFTNLPNKEIDKMIERQREIDKNYSNSI